MITFKETPQFLSPSESFKLRKNIQEVEDDLRFFFAWKPSKSNANTLPNWLDKKLKKFPYLQKHTKNFLSFLHTQTSTFNGTQQSLYDILISCVITDWIMAALQKYEKQYRIKEFRTVLHPQTTEKDSPNNFILESKAYFDWLFPNLSDSIKMSNLRRKPLHSYYNDTDDNSFLPRTLDMEFLQAITVLYNNYLRKGDLRYMLSPACFLPLMKQHPYFVYSLEKYFGYYQTHCKRNDFSLSTCDELIRSLYDDYDYSPHIYNYLQAFYRSVCVSYTDLLSYYEDFSIVCKKNQLRYDDFDLYDNLQTAHQDFSTSYENLLAYYNDFPVVCEDLPTSYDDITDLYEALQTETSYDLKDATRDYYYSLFQLVQLLREWLRLFSNRYYSFAFQDEGNSNSLLRFQNADDAVAIDPLIYNCFTTKERLKHYRFAVNLLKKRGHSLSPDLDKQLYYSFFCTSYDEDRYKILCSLKKQLHKNDIPTNISKLFYLCFSTLEFVENPQFSALRQFRELVCSPEITRRLAYTLNEASLKKVSSDSNKDTDTNLHVYLQKLQTALESAKRSHQYDDIFCTLSALFSDSKSFKIPPIPSKLMDNKTLNKEISKYRKQAQAARKELPSAVASFVAALNDFTADALELSLEHKKQRHSYGYTHPFWFQCEPHALDMLEGDPPSVPILFEPNDYVTGPCTKMFFTRLHRIIWPKASSDPNTSYSTADYFIGAFVTAHLLEQQMVSAPSPALDEVYFPGDSFLDEDEESEVTNLWLWAQNFLKTAQSSPQYVDNYEGHAAQVPHKLPLKMSGTDFPLLTHTIQWFYPEDTLTNLMYDILLSTEDKLLDSCWFLLPSDQLISRAEDHLSKGADYWNSIRQNQDPFAND